MSSPKNRPGTGEENVADGWTVAYDSFVVASFDGADATRWDKIGFVIPNATASAVKVEGLSDAEHERMVAGNLSLFVKGKLTKANGQSCRPNASTDCGARTEVTFTRPRSSGWQ